jgi:diguanylate cyclase (GGDEF)-like protein/PAS domain S-box-containing protein
LTIIKTVGGLQLKLNKRFIFLFLLIIIFIVSINTEVLAQKIIINEIMASNQATIPDSDSDFEDWIELKNISDQSVNLSGYYLSDKTDELSRWQFNPNQDFIIEPGGLLLIWADDETDEGQLHTNFKLSNNGETISLVGTDGTEIIDQLQYPQLMTDISYGRNINNQSQLLYFLFPTPEQENSFGLSSYYWIEKAKFLFDNKFISVFFFVFLLIILILLISYYKLSKKIKTSKSKYKKLFKNSPVGLLTCDIKGNIIDVNQEMVELLGAPNKEEIKKFNLNNIKKVKEIWNDEFLASDYQEVLEGEINYTTHWNKDVYLKYKVEIILAAGAVSEVIIAANDISKEKEIEIELKYLSFHDELTGLYNRRYFEKELERLNQSRNIPISIIIGDLDDLKYINDNFGHKIGDKYIIKAAEIIKNNFRDEDIVARIGGDEFAILLPETPNETAAEISERIKEKAREQKEYKNLGISIGFAAKENHSDNLEEVFIKADKELYKDKENK